MQPNADYQQLLTDVIKKQIALLGPDIALSRARSVKGLIVADDGTVIELQGPPQELTNGLINQFVELSGLIVRKTMEPLLTIYPDGVVTPPQITTQPPVANNTPISNNVNT